MEDLAEFIKRIRDEKGLSLNDVVRNSGGKISNAYVSQIENNQIVVSKITSSKLEALAKGLKEPDEVIFLKARGEKGKALNPIVNQITIYATQLTENRQKDLLEMAKVFFKQEQESQNLKPKDSNIKPQKPSPEKLSKKNLLNKENEKSGAVERKIIDGEESVIIKSPEDYRKFREEFLLNETGKTKK